jgi:hypothetical protein
MSFKTTGILALLLCLLGGYIYFFEIRGWESQEEANEMARRVASLEKGKVARFTLDSQGESIVAVRDGFSWNIISPVETQGDYDMIEGVIHSAGDLEKAGIAADSIQVRQPDFNLADFGLASPSVRLSFTNDAGKQESLAFGDRSPTGAYFYVKTSEDDQIYLVEGRFYFSLGLSLLDVRDKRYVQFDPDRLMGIELVIGDQTMAVQRDETHWRMTVPVEDGGDDSGIGQFLTQLRDARVEAFLDGTTLAEAGLDDPWFTVNLYEGSERKLNGVAFGRKSGVREYRKYLASSLLSPQVFEADSAFVHSLINSGEAFRTRDVFGFNRHLVDRVEITFPDSQMAFSKRGPEIWDVTSHPNHLVAGKRVEDFIDEITALRAVNYVAESMDEARKEVFDTNGIHIRLFEKDELLRELVVGALGKHLYASTNDRIQILEIDQYFLQRIRDVRISPKPNASEG